MGDIDHRCLESFVKFADLDSHLYAQRRIEIGEGLIEQERLRLAHNRAPDRDPLTLAAGKLARLAIEIVGQVQRTGRLAHFLIDDVRALSSHFERESDVAAHAHVRIERVGLEHHGEPALRGTDIGHVLGVDEHLSGGDVLETGDEAQKRRLATAGRPDEHRELAVFDVEIDAVDDADRAERFPHVFQLDASHGGNSLLRDHLTAPKVKPRTSCFCENQPRMRMGAMASVDAAESLAQKKPSGAEYEAMKAGSGAAL